MFSQQSGYWLLAIDISTPRVIILWFLLFSYLSSPVILLSKSLSLRVEKTEMGGLGVEKWNQNCSVSHLPSGSHYSLLRSSGRVHRRDSYMCPVTPGKQQAGISHSDSHHWTWIWVLKKRQDHFSPYAASCIHNAVSNYQSFMECPVKRRYCSICLVT